MDLNIYSLSKQFYLKKNDTLQTRRLALSCVKNKNLLQDKLIIRDANGDLL